MLTVSELAEKINAKLKGDGSIRIKAVGPVEGANPDDITFIADEKHLSLLEKTNAAAVILAAPAEGFAGPQLIVDDVNATLIETLNIFAPELKPVPAGIHSSVVLGSNVKVADDAAIGPGVVIADDVTVGSKCVIGAGCKINQNSVIGNNTRLDCNVVVYHNCTVGNNVIIQANSVIGSTGYGYNFINNSHQLVPHNGGVVVEDFVEIGAGCCIDRAKFGNTVIGAGTKMDNLVHVAHNVIIGKCCLIMANVGLAGSSKLGDGVVLAGQVGIRDNVKIGDGVMIGAQAGVMNDIPAGEKVVGSPAINVVDKMKQIAITQKLPELAKQLKKLTKKVEALEAADDNKK